MRNTHSSIKILLIATQQIGDVLLSTPLLRSLREAYPDAVIDVLAYKSTCGILMGNPDCDTIIEVDNHPSFAGYWRLLRRILRRYSLALTTQGNDRAHQYAFLAAKTRIGMIPSLDPKHAWKRKLSRHWCLLDDENTHTVVQNLMLASKIGIPLKFQVTTPTDPSAETTLDRLLPFAWRTTPFVVLHPYPMWRYKRWTDEGWRTLMQHLSDRKLYAVLTGGPATEEQAYGNSLAAAFPGTAFSLAGKTSFGTLSHLLHQAAAYVGPDTVTTHLAAACGTRTVAFYGPSNPVKWGPWPKGCTRTPSPWRMIEQPWQLSGNVLLLQGEGNCVPCREEGCDRHKNSDSRCLTELPAQRIIDALEYMLSQSCAS